MEEELKKAAREYAKTKKEFEEKQLEIELPMGAYFMSIDAFLAGAKWQAEQDQETIELAEDHAYLAGAVNEREKIMKGAVEGIVRPYDGEIWLDSINALSGFADSDKVRIIIVKED